MRGIGTPRSAITRAPIALILRHPSTPSRITGVVSPRYVHIIILYTMTCIIRTQSAFARTL